MISKGWGIHNWITPKHLVIFFFICKGFITSIPKLNYIWKSFKVKVVNALTFIFVVAVIVVVVAVAAIVFFIAVVLCKKNLNYLYDSIFTWCFVQQCIITIHLCLKFTYMYSGTMWLICKCMYKLI